MRSPDRRTVLTAAGGALAALFAGCQGNDSPGTDTATPTASATPTPTAAPTTTVPTTRSQTPTETTTPTPVDGTFEQRAREFIALLDSEEYQAAYDRLTPTAAESISADGLESVWAGQEQEFGAFQTISALTSGEQNGATVVRAVLTFADARLNAVFTFTGEGVHGFQLLPFQGEWTPPEYATPSSFSEREFTLSAPGECSLGATLTIPDGVDSAPGVVIVHGQGAMDRDGSFGTNKIYKDIAWGLASRGIAVLRYDKRSYACSMNMAEATIDDVVTDDALTAVQRLRATDVVADDSVFVAGHSIGGTLAPRIAARDGNLAGVVMLAALHRPGAQAIVEQNEFLAERDGTVTESEQRTLEQVRQLADRIRSLEVPDDEVLYIGGDEYWRSLQEYEHDARASELTIPQLYLQGERDYQVTVEADFEAWQAALGDTQAASFKTYGSLNHHFMPGTGTPGRMEYFQENHVAESVLMDIAGFVSENA